MDETLDGWHRRHAASQGLTVLLNEAERPDDGATGTALIFRAAVRAGHLI